MDQAPQWSPSLADGTTSAVALRRAGSSKPQWSPSLADGTTHHGDGHRARAAVPQWSPSLADGTTGDDGADAASQGLAAMEPVLGGRDDLLGRASEGLAPPAAMEPVLGGRDDLRKHCIPCRGASGRNGARPWRTGRRPATIDGVTTVLVPQWSPSLADGTTIVDRAPLTPDQKAAMEPVLGGRDDAAHPAGPSRHGGAAMEPVLGGRDDESYFTGFVAGYAPQWSPSLADGTTRRLCLAVCKTLCSRNGARPWRTGRPGGVREDDRPEGAAMEPVLGGRDDVTGRRGVQGIVTGAAMEPVLGGRDDL